MREPPATWRNSETGEAGHRSMFWPYLPEHGDEPLGFTARYEYPSGKPKDVIPFFVHTDDGQIRAGAAPEPRPLFGLDTLNRTGPVYITEGEKDAAALHSIGLAALTSPGGSRAPGKADWTPLQAALTAGRELIIWPDNDASGRAYAAAVAQLIGPGCACLVSLPQGTPNKPKAGAADWLAAALAELGIQWDGLRALDLPVGHVAALQGQLEAAAAPVLGKVPVEWDERHGTDTAAKLNGHKRPGVSGIETDKRRYQATDSGIFLVWIEGTESKQRQLANFSAQIVEEVLLDDGAEQSRTLTIHGKRQGRTLPPLNLTCEQFDLMKWPLRYWGSGCFVEVGQNNKEILKAAIQHLSHNGSEPGIVDPENRTVI
jgi:hypothetical protein